VGGAEYLTALIGEVPTSAHVIRYATIVADKAALRKMIAVGLELRAAAYKNPLDVAQLADRAIGRLHAIAEDVRAEPTYRAAATATRQADPSKLMEATPADGFIGDFCAWAEPSTDAPPHFHVLSALVCVGTALGRDCFVPFGTMNIWPNLYAILIAPSSRFRKSSVQRAATRVLGHLTIDSTDQDGDNETVLLPQEFSPESFFAALARRPTGVLVWSEFGQALQQFGRKYMAGTPEFLTEAYDCPPRLERPLRQERFVIERPCISIYAATTPEWLSSNMKESTAIGGFLPRSIFFAAAEEDRRPFMALPPALAADGELRLAQQLSEIRSSYCGEEPVGMDARPVTAAYEALALDLDRACRGGRSEALRDAFLTRLGPLALKLAMLFDIAERPGTRKLTPESFDRAATTISYLRAYIDELISDELAFTEHEEWRRKALQAIRDARADGIRLRALQRGPLRGLRKRERDELLEGLQEEGLCVITKGRRPERGPAPDVVIATDLRAA